MEVKDSFKIANPFDLAVTNDMQSRMDSWAKFVFDEINNVSGVKILRLAITLEAINADAGRSNTVIPKDRLESSDTITARQEALRLGRITIAGNLPGEGNTEKPTSVAIPLAERIGGPDSVLTIEAMLPTDEAVSRIISIIGLSLGWPSLFRQEDKILLASDKESKSIDALKSITSLSVSESFDESARALVTDLADRFQCDRVVLGLARRNSVKLEAISHIGKFKRSMLLSRQLRAAMEEAFDQETIIVWPVQEKSPTHIFSDHATLAENDPSRSILSVPLFDGKNYVGVLLFERSHKSTFSVSDIEALEAISSILTPLIIEKRQNSRILIFKAFSSLKYTLKLMIGRSHFGLKLIILSAIILTTLLIVVERPKTVVADAVIQGVETRTISAPFDGFISEAHVSEGDQISQGDILVQLDMRELSIERMRLTALRTQAELELDRAISSRDRAEAALVEARVRQIEAQMALTDQQIERSLIKAPFDALVISGDLTRSVGRAITRGEPLMVVAPLEEYRVMISAREADVSLLAPGQHGRLRLAPMPERSFDITLTELVPVARYENNETLYSLEGRLNENPLTLLHGMSGSARIEIEDVPLAVLWGKPLLDRLRMWIWRNFPV